MTRLTMTKKTAALPNPVGRPPVHGPEVEDRICELIADGNPLPVIAALPGMPRVATILGWAAGDRPGFGDRYTRAREALAIKLVADALELVDAPAKDAVEAQDKRTRADMRKWLASKLFPKQFGDRVHADVQALGADGNPTSPLMPVLNIVIEAPAEAAPKAIEASRWRQDDE
jgi:hypothetical protein